MGKLKKKPAKLVEQAEQARPAKTKTETKTTPSDAPITASELRDMMMAEVNCLRDILQSLATIEELLKDIRSNQTTWPFQLHDRGRHDKPGWDRNATPPDDPPSTIRWPMHPPYGPRWPTDPWGNPAPYAVYCGGGEGPQCQHR